MSKIKTFFFWIDDNETGEEYADKVDRTINEFLKGKELIDIKITNASGSGSWCGCYTVIYKD